MAEIKKIGFNGRPFCQSGVRGLSRHTLELILNLKQSHPGLQFYVYCYEGVSDFYKQRLPFVVFRDEKVRPKILWDLYYLGRDVRRDGIDVFHSTNNLGVPLVFGTRPRIITTIHDHFTHAARMPWGNSPGSWWSAFNYRLELLLLKRSDLFLTVSNDARSKISQWMNLSEQKIKVAYNGSSLRPVEYSGDADDFYIYVGGFEDRKNVNLMLEAFIEFASLREKPVKLVLAGSKRYASAQVRILLENHSQFFEVRENIDDRELAILYQTAQALIFPSLEEGFGLPLVEAMSIGCPVIASNINVFKEIGGDAIRYFNVLERTSLVAALMKFEYEISLRSKQIEHGFEQARKYSWQQMAENIFSNYVSEKQIDL